MGRFSVLIVAVAVCVVLAVSVLFAQQGGAPQGSGGTAASSAARDQDRLKALLDQADLTEAERTAAESAVRAKLAARQQLTTALGDLRRAGEDATAADDQLKQAMSVYRKALAAYRGKVEAEDGSLAAKLSVPSQARCLALGILDNGFDTAFRRGGGGARPAQ